MLLRRIKQQVKDLEALAMIQLCELRNKLADVNLTDEAREEVRNRLGCVKMELEKNRKENGNGHPKEAVQQ